MSDTKKVLYVVNPVAGRGKAAECQEAVVQTMTSAGWNVEVRRTERSGQATQIVASEGERFDLVVCCGGDGTYHEMLSGVMQLKKRPDVGYIPAGTTNDFAFSMGLPKDPIQAARAIIEGEPYPCDIGAFNDSVFSYTAAFGAFTNVTYETSQDLKNNLGKLAYVIEAVKNLPQITSYRMLISTRDFAYDEEFLFGMVANSLSVAGMRGLAGRGVEMDDGLLEAVFIRKTANPVILGEIAQRLLSGRPYHEYILSFKVDEMRIESPGAPWTLDGEYGGSPDKILIRDLHKAITIIRPKSKK